MKNMPYDVLSVMHYGPKVIAKTNIKDHHFIRPSFFVVYWFCNCIIALISKTLTTQHEKYSEDDKDVFTYLYGLPDDTWLKPDEKDPLSVVDQVNNIIFAKRFSANVF